jgi:CTP:molybdopterin cytidylyltransferase MocA
LTISEDINSKICVVIPAAGRASRMGGEAGATIRKPLLQLSNDHTILDVVLRMARSVSDDVVVGVPHGEVATFAGSSRQPSASWIECEVGIGLTRTVQYLLRHVAENCTTVVILADDFSVPSDLSPLVASVGQGAWASQGVVYEANPGALSRACRVGLEGDRILSVVEKPQGIEAGWRGCGIYCMSPYATDALRSADPDVTPDLSAAYSQWLVSKRDIRASLLDVNVNINTTEDLAAARALFANLLAANN